MAKESRTDTRARIIEVALTEFAESGFHATSLREIAERVGVSKAAVLYHFQGKADILGALAEPMLTDLESAMRTAAKADPADRRWAAIEGLLDVWLTHRHLLSVNLNDLAMAASGTIFQRFRDGMLRANVLVAGRNPTLADRITAAQAIAMLSDPVVLFPDAPVATVRAEVLRGVHRLLDRTEPQPSPSAEPAEHRARRGRPAVMDEEMAVAARRLHAQGRGAAEIAGQLGVSRATVYRHLAD